MEDEDPQAVDFAEVTMAAQKKIQREREREMDQEDNAPAVYTHMYVYICDCFLPFQIPLML